MSETIKLIATLDGGNVIIMVPMEDPLLHGDVFYVYCDSFTCPCHHDHSAAGVALIEETIGRPLRDGLLTEREGMAIFMGLMV